MKIKIGITLGIIAILFFATPVFATAQPDTTPTLSNIKANRNLLVDGDALIYGEYYLPYAVPPDEPADDTYIFRLMNGATELGAISPYVYFDRGYNHGVFAFYLETGDWDLVIPTWTIRISQSPPYFAVPDSWDFAIPSTSYTSNTTQEDNQTELSINVISMAERLEVYFPTYSLLEDSPGGTVLSSPTGETYFRGAIYGIQAMGPVLFLVQVSEIDTDAHAWTTAEFDAYSAQYADTWVADDMTATANQWGMTPGAIMALIFAFPVCIGAIVLTRIKYRRTEPGIILAFVVIITCAVMGWFPMALFATIFQLCAIYIAYVWWSTRSHQFLSFYTTVWFLSVIICLIIEGSALGAYQNSVINDLSLFTTLRIGGLVTIPAPNIFFFRGLMRILLWDYSFYTGGYVYLKYFWMVMLSPSVVWQIGNLFAPVFANFLRLG
jgi:hypothetical protein